jgi:uncharacterized protein YdaU (DUF1376 family)
MRMAFVCEVLLGDVLSFAFLPLYTGDYLRDTRHLTTEEHGAYVLMLMHCWDQKGPVPLDERKQSGICNARSGGEIESMRRVLSEFFVKMDDGWYNHRMQEEVVKSEMVSKNRSKAGQISASIRARNKLRRGNATPVEQVLTPVEHVSVPPPSPPSTYNADALLRTNGDATLRPANAVVLNTASSNQRLAGLNGEKKSNDLSRATRLTDQWALPLEWGNWALQERSELTRDAVKEIAKEFHDHWLGQPGQRGVKLDWYATWRNWIRRERRMGNKQLSVGDHNQRALAEWKSQRREKLINDEEKDE